MPTNCKKCNAQIEFIKTTAGKFMPVDIEPRVTIVTDKGEVKTGRISHFATCPAADEFRRKK